jgi:amidase
MPDCFADLDATAQAELVRKKEATPLELVDAAITRIERLNPHINAVVTPAYDIARDRAKALNLPQGPFRGVPFLLKDLVLASKDEPLGMGNRVLREQRFVPAEDSYLATRFRAAGLVSLGKTNTPELGLIPTTEPVVCGPTRNPWDLGRSPGGSSGGSAAAVATRMVPMAHGNDGGGSIRIPASACGVVGLKPTRGRVSLGPVLAELWHGLATEGVLSLTVRDTAAALDAISGMMPGDPYSAPAKSRPYTKEIGRDPGKLRIGIMDKRPVSSEPIHAECVAAVTETGKMLEAAGHMVERSHPAALDEEFWLDAVFELVFAHTARTLEELQVVFGRPVTAEDVEPWTWYLAEKGRRMSATRYIEIGDGLFGCARRAADWWAQGFDLLVTPTLAELPPPLGWMATDGAVAMESLRKRDAKFLPFTPFFNVSGQPAMSLPLHWTKDGLPVGVQLVAALGREDLILQVAAQLEQAVPWTPRRPALLSQ